MRGARLFFESARRLGLRSELPAPGADGLFRRFGRPFLLPWYRVYWNVPGAGPPWKPETWTALAGGWIRFFRPDHLLECESELLTAERRTSENAPADETDRGLLGERFRRRLVHSWLVPADGSLLRVPGLADALVETIRLGKRGGRFTWNRGGGSHQGAFPGEVRADCPPGLDPVHTPESERAGLRRFLCVGWSIDDDGGLAGPGGAAGWGPVTGGIARRLHDAPRRLMLGCSLAAGAAPLAKGHPPGAIPGVTLRAAAVCGGAYSGWVHEDAFVLSESAARKLAVRRESEVHALIPAAASGATVTVKGVGSVVSAGDTVVSAVVDLFALGFSRPDVEKLGLDPGAGLQILPWKTRESGEIVAIRREPIESGRWRESIAVTLKETTEAPVRVGDKLGTGHGLKGVVSRIVPSSAMPGGAEILLPYFGVVRRGAFGQLREMGLESLPTADREVVAAGEIVVHRQAQDAAPRCRVRGARTGARGQRYGEWELMALVAHGAGAVLTELLSSRRAAAGWVEREERLWKRASGPEPSRGQLLCRALNRYLAAVGDVHVESGAQPRVMPGAAVVDVFDLELYGRKSDGEETKSPRPALVREALALLEDEDAWESKGGTARLRVKTRGGERTHLLLPPWLRRAAPGHRHPLTLAYARLIHAGTWWERVVPAEREVWRCLRHEAAGLPGFVRNHVLGRRLTRSARAVIVPRPDLRIDQVAIPRKVASELFADLPDEASQVVLVNRNPTLHRRGLLALRPVIDDSPDANVFGLPLGILSSLAADFDGDQASVVALETPEARREALEKLLPGAPGLRRDTFRMAAAFPLLKELSAPERELDLARNDGLPQEEWAEAHKALVDDLLSSLPSSANRVWIEREVAENDPGSSLWSGLGPEEWVQRSVIEVGELCKGQRRKAVYGGILRRELYRRDATDLATFSLAIEALQAITERLVQGALKLKGMKLVDLPPVREVEAFLADPRAEPLLPVVDPVLDGEALTRALGTARRLSREDLDPLRKWLSNRGNGTLTIPGATPPEEVPENYWLRLLLGG